MKFIQKQFIAVAILFILPIAGGVAHAATNATTFDAETGMLSVAGSCSGRYALIIIKNSSSSSIWGSSNPPCVNGTYSYSIAVPPNMRSGGTFFVNVMDNGIPNGGTASQPVVFTPSPEIDQTATSAALSITLDTSTISSSTDDVSFLDGIIQNIFGMVTTADNTIESSIVAAVHFFAKIFTILPGGSIVVPHGQNQISGQGLLAAGTTNIFIPNTSVTSSSQIIVTPTTPTQVPLSVTALEDGDGFDVGTISAQPSAISFTWLIIGTYSTDPSGVVPAAAPVPQIQQGGGGGGGSDDGGETVTIPASVVNDASSTDLTASSSDDTSIVSTTTIATTTVSTTTISTTTDISEPSSTIISIATTTTTSVLDATDASGTTQ